MSLYPGAPRQPSPGKWVLDDQALAKSMALEIETQMDQLLLKLKGAGLPAEGKEDRRLLFVAIARGVLKYLYDHREAIDAVGGPWPHSHSISLTVTMNSHTTH